MKKILIFTLLLSSCVSISLAQLELKPAFGINVASFKSNPRFDSKNDSLVAGSKAGYQIGASLAIGRKLYVEPGIFFTGMNQTFTPTNIENEKSEFTFSPSYLRIPVNFGFQFIGSTNSIAGLRIYLGPSMMIPLNVKENSYPLVKEDLKSPQFDFSVGAGLNVWLIFLDVSYGWGLTPQFKDDSIEAKMQAFYANIGFRFKLKNEE
jgi:hypothetical protein